MTSKEFDDRLEALTRRYELPNSATGQLRALVALLADDPLAPTAVRDPCRVIDDHIADSLVALELERIHSAASIADLGSGAGLPGLPLAIALPAADVALVESAARKAAFLERAAVECGVPNARIVRARVEEWGDGLGRFDVVAARALASFEVVVEYAAPVLRIGGTLIAWRGGRKAHEEAAAAETARVLGMEVGEIRAVHPYPEARFRHLHLFSKAKETPPGFPRRPGMARKRPLAATAGPSRAPSDRARR